MENKNHYIIQKNTMIYLLDVHKSKRTSKEYILHPTVHTKEHIIGNVFEKNKNCWFSKLTHVNKSVKVVKTDVQNPLSTDIIFKI